MMTKALRRSRPNLPRMRGVPDSNIGSNRDLTADAANSAYPDQIENSRALYIWPMLTFIGFRSISPAIVYLSQNIDLSPGTVRHAGHSKEKAHAPMFRQDVAARKVTQIGEDAMIKAVYIFPVIWR
jgi:hypothetical protein